MVKFFSSEFFTQLQDSLANDAKWQEGTKGLKTSIKLSTSRSQRRLFVPSQGGGGKDGHLSV